jgi:hypothetical protein
MAQEITPGVISSVPLPVPEPVPVPRADTPERSRFSTAADLRSVPTWIA